MDLIPNKKRKERKNFDNEVNLAIGSTLEKFGSANAEFFNEYARLNSMKESWQPNIETQKGFAAEVKHVSRTNAENILNENGRRIARTDDIGAVNHPEFDSVEVDTKGNAKLDASGNFIGGAQQKVHNDVSAYDKYYKTEVGQGGKIVDLYGKYKNGKLDVPSDQIDEIKKRWTDQINKLEREEAYLRKAGKADLADQKKEEASRIKDTKSRLRDSKVSVDESREARVQPWKSVAKDIAKVSHKAGVQSAKMGGALSGGLSAGKNAKELINGEKDVQEAIADVTKDTAKGAVKSYVTGAASSAIGGALKNSSNQIYKNLAKKSGPTAILQTAVILAKQTGKLILGEITPEQFAENIGREGASLASSLTGANLGATVGAFIAPGVGTVIGGVVGGMVASMMSSALYYELKKTIQETKLSDEKRKMMEEFCQQLIEHEMQYRNRVISVFDRFLDVKDGDIRDGFNAMALAIQNGGSIQNGLQLLGNAFKLRLMFETPDDFRLHVARGDMLRL